MSGTPANAAARNIITQEAFAVAPQLLGLPLARPSRRLVAILLDLLVVTILANVGGGVLLGLAAGFTFFRLAARATWGSGHLLTRAARRGLQAVGAVILFAVSISLWGQASDRIGGGDDDGEGPAVAAAMAGGEERRISILGGIRTAADVIALREAETEGDARAAAERSIAALRRTGLSDPEIHQALAAVAAEGEEDGKEWMPEVVEAALEAAEVGRVPAVLDRDSVAVALAEALEDRDTAALDTLRPRLGSLLAGDSLSELRERAQELRQERDHAREALEEERERGFVRGFLAWLNDAGVGFGWSGLYFTAFTALWKGQTPGKRLMGIRVLRLNGLPMTLWAAFERFGGYAAGLFTGMLGFAQVYWDRNRQAIHDKITETVVIRERKDVPLPAPRAAAAPVPSTPSRPIPPAPPRTPPAPPAPPPPAGQA